MSADFITPWELILIFSFMFIPPWAAACVPLFCFLKKRGFGKTSSWMAVIVTIFCSILLTLLLHQFLPVRIRLFIDTMDLRLFNSTYPVMPMAWISAGICAVIVAVSFLKTRPTRT